MGRAGESKTFLAVAATLMAGLVIATMVAINAKLQSALAPSIERAGAPALKMIPPMPAPLLQSTAAPSIANSVPNSGANSFNNWTPATPHAVSSPKRGVVTPAAPKPPVAIVPTPSSAPVPATPPPPSAGAQPPAAPTPLTPAPAVLPSVTPVPLPVVVVGSPPAIPPTPGLAAVATTTVTVVPQPDLGDGAASGGETHRGQRGDRDRANPDLTATPAGPEAVGDSEIRPEGNDGDDRDDGKVGHPDGNADPRGPGDGPEQADEHG